MKKLLLTVGILAFLTPAYAAPYVLPSPQPGALTSYDWQPTYSLDFVYAISGNSDNYGDMMGPRLALNLYNNQNADFRHQWNLSVAALWGDKTKTFTETIGTGTETHDWKGDQFAMPIMLGYNLNIAITDNVLFYLGGKAGVVIWNQDNTDNITLRGLGNFNTYSTRTDSDTKSEFTYSIGAGFKFIASESIQINLGYEFQKMYVDPNLTQHVLSVGVGVTF